MRMTIAAVLLATASVSNAGPASPEFSISVGGTTGPDVPNLFIGGHDPDTEPPPTLDPDGHYSGGGARIAAGMLINGWAGLEAGWARLASEDSRTSHFGAFGCPGVSPTDSGFIIVPVEQRASAKWFAFVPTMRRESFDLFGKIGGARVTNRSRQSCARTNVRQEHSDEILLGVGATYFLFRHVGVRVEAEHFGGHGVTLSVSLVGRWP